MPKTAGTEDLFPLSQIINIIMSKFVDEVKKATIAKHLAITRATVGGVIQLGGIDGKKIGRELLFTPQVERHILHEVNKNARVQALNCPSIQ